MIFKTSSVIKSSKLNLFSTLLDDHTHKILFGNLHGNKYNAACMFPVHISFNSKPQD